MALTPPRPPSPEGKGEEYECHGKAPQAGQRGWRRTGCHVHAPLCRSRRPRCPRARDGSPISVWSTSRATRVGTSPPDPLSIAMERGTTQHHRAPPSPVGREGWAGGVRAVRCRPQLRTEQTCAGAGQHGRAEAEGVGGHAHREPRDAVGAGETVDAMERRGRAILRHADDEGAPGKVVQVGGGIARDHRMRRQGGTQRRDDRRRERPATDYRERSEGASPRGSAPPIFRAGR